MQVGLCGRPGLALYTRRLLRGSPYALNDIPALSLPCFVDSISIPYGAWSIAFASEMKTKGGIYHFYKQQVTDASYCKCG